MSLLFNAGRAIPKGTPRNFIPPQGIDHLAVILIKLWEEEKLSRIVDHTELKKNDYNISPSRCIHTADEETYRSLAEIVKDLDVVEAEVMEADKALRGILLRIRV